MARKKTQKCTLNPLLAANVKSLQQYLLAYGVRTTVTSGCRSYASQAKLYNARATNPFPVSPPGSSSHEKGLAIDLVVTSFSQQGESRWVSVTLGTDVWYELTAQIMKLAPAFNLTFPAGWQDPIHIQNGLPRGMGTSLQYNSPQNLIASSPAPEPFKDIFEYTGVGGETYPKARLRR